ncbi:MAG: DUF5522 domain-containing protein [Myxococcota bacterium]
MGRPLKPQPGVDYYVEEGKVVFTAHYLLRRGYCCNKGCRHCPYKAGATSPIQVTFEGLELRGRTPGDGSSD